MAVVASVAVLYIPYPVTPAPLKSGLRLRSDAAEPMSEVSFTKWSVTPVEDGPVKVKAVPVVRDEAVKVIASVVVPVKVWVKVPVPEERVRF